MEAKTSDKITFAVNSLHYQNNKLKFGCFYSLRSFTQFSKRFSPELSNSFGVHKFSWIGNVLDAPLKLCINFSGTPVLWMLSALRWSCMIAVTLLWCLAKILARWYDSKIFGSTSTIRFTGASCWLHNFKICKSFN